MASRRFANAFRRSISTSSPALARVAALGAGVLVAVGATPASCAGQTWASWLGLGGGAGGPVDYNKVAQSIADLLETNPDYDDGSYGPLFVRLGKFSLCARAKPHSLL